MKDDFVGVIKQVAAFLDKEVNNVFLDELASLFSSSSKVLIWIWFEGAHLKVQK